MHESANEISNVHDEYVHVHKYSDVHDIIYTIKDLNFNNNGFLDREGDGSGVEAVAVRSNDNRLSQRELEIVRLLGAGLSNLEISNTLFISQNTVRTYIHRIIGKLNLRSRCEVCLYAYKNSIY